MEEPEDNLRVRLTATAGRIQNKKVERVFLPMFRVTSSLPSSVGYQSILFLPVSSILKSHNAVISAEDSVTIVPLAQLNQMAFFKKSRTDCHSSSSGGFPHSSSQIQN